MPSDSSLPTGNMESQRIDLERFKAKLDFRKFIWGSVVAAIAIAAIPPCFQLATALLESVKSNAQLRLDKQTKDSDRQAKEEEFYEGYIKDFLASALSQDVELRIRFAQYFASVSAGTYREGWVNYRDNLVKHREEVRSGIDSMEAEWWKIKQAQERPGANIDKLERNLAWLYKEVGYVERNRSVTSDPRIGDYTVGSGPSLGQNITNYCEKEFDAYRNDSAAFVRAVAADAGIKLEGTADDIINLTRSQKDWLVLPDGVAAADYARNGYLVIAGMKGSESAFPSPIGHVVIVVDGPLSHGLYPTAYWGSLAGSAGRSQTINWSFTSSDRDKVRYAARRDKIVQAP